MTTTLSYIAAAFVHLGLLCALRFQPAADLFPKKRYQVVQARIISASPKSEASRKAAVRPPQNPKSHAHSSAIENQTVIAQQALLSEVKANESVEESALSSDSASDSGSSPDSLEHSIRQVPHAAYASNPEPEYPRMSRRLREEGKVVLKVLVSGQGKVLNCEIVQSSGFERLDSSALETVKSWVFKFGVEENSAEGWVIVPVNFSLNS